MVKVVYLNSNRNQTTSSDLEVVLKALKN